MIDATLRKLRRIDFGDLIQIAMLDDGSALYVFEHGRVLFGADGPSYELDDEPLVAYAAGQPRDWHGRFARGAGAAPIEVAAVDEAHPHAGEGPQGDIRINVQPDDLKQLTGQAWQVEHNGMKIRVNGTPVREEAARIADAVSIASDVADLPEATGWKQVDGTYKPYTHRPTVEVHIEPSPEYGVMGWTDPAAIESADASGIYVIHLADDRMSAVIPAGHHPRSTVGLHIDTQVVIHEYGHLMDDTTGFIANARSISGVDSGIIGLKVPPRRSAEISNYAESSQAEYDAEQFLEWTATGGTTKIASVKAAAKEYGWKPLKPKTDGTGAIVAYAAGQPRDWHGRFARSAGAAPGADPALAEALDLQHAFQSDERINIHPEDLTRESLNTWTVDHNGLHIRVRVSPGDDRPDPVARIADAVSVASDVKPLPPDIKVLEVREETGTPPGGAGTMGWTDYDERAISGVRTIHLAVDRHYAGRTQAGEFSPAHVLTDQGADEIGAGEDTSTVIHEYGHLVDFAYGPISEGGWETALKRPPAAAKNLGFYVQGSQAEYDAESFAEWTLSAGTTKLKSVQDMAEKYGWKTPRRSG